MKIKCIRLFGSSCNLTIGKIYESNVVANGFRDDIIIRIIDDIGEICWYPSEWFMTIDEWRNELLNKILP